MAKKRMVMAGEGVMADVGFSGASVTGLSKKGAMQSMAEQEQPEYPYCLKLYLSHDELEMLGVKELPALNSVLDIMAKAKVVALREEKDNCTMELQITDMALGAPKKEKSPQAALYGESEDQSVED